MSEKRKSLRNKHFNNVLGFTSQAMTISRASGETSERSESVFRFD